jgi:hypothetical protein
MKVFPRLRHNSLVSRNDQDQEIDAGRPGHHVPNKPFMTGNVDNPEGSTVWKSQGGEPEFDRDPPLFLLLETVGVHAGKAFDQRRLAVVHMTGRSHHEMLHGPENNRLTRFSQQQR